MSRAAGVGHAFQVERQMDRFIPAAIYRGIQAHALSPWGGVADRPHIIPRFTKNVRYLFYC